MLLPLQLQQPHGGIESLERSNYAVGHIRQKLDGYHGARQADLSKQTKGCRLLTGPGTGVIVSPGACSPAIVGMEVHHGLAKLCKGLPWN